jgi:hypothetical protein
MTTPTKTREQLMEERLRERAAARAKFGDRSVYDVLLKLRTRLALLSDFAGAKAEEGECADLSQDGWIGLDDTLHDLASDLAMLDDALPADVSNWRPGQGGADDDREGGA